MRLDLAPDLLRAAHPWLWADTFHPIGKRRDEAEILDDMLLADPARRDDPAGRQGDGRTEDGLGQEDALGMVAERAVPEIRDDRFAGVEPAMERQLIVDRSTPFPHRGQRMMIRMCHRSLPQNTCWVYSEVSIRSL